MVQQGKHVGSLFRTETCLMELDGYSAVCNATGMQLDGGLLKSLRGLYDDTDIVKHAADACNELN